jgi:hypothetical protein
MPSSNGTTQHAVRACQHRIMRVDRAKHNRHAALSGSDKHVWVKKAMARAKPLRTRHTRHARQANSRGTYTS